MTLMMNDPSFFCYAVCLHYKDRQVTLKKFHGQKLVDIREFYVDKLSRDMKPGKCLGLDEPSLF